MNDKELDALLAETLGEPIPAPLYLDARLRGELVLARTTPKGISLWWLPLALSLGVGVVACLWSLLLPWPVSVLLGVSAVFTVAMAVIFTVIGLWRFDLKEKGRVFL